MSTPSYLSLLQQGPILTSTITAPTVNLTSSMISLGSSAAATKPTTNSSGSYAATSWIQSTPAGQAAAKSVKMSSTAQYQLIVTPTAVYLSSNTGLSWTTVSGLPVGITWLNGSVSATGQYMTLTEVNGVWISSNFGVSFAMSTAGAPSTWLRFENNTTDSGSAGITPTLAPAWTPTYVASSTKSSGSFAVNLANTAGGTATNYIRGTLSGFSNIITISGWFNLQTTSSSPQVIFSTAATYIVVYINGTSNTIGFNINGGPGVTTGFGVVTNTWYHFTAIAQGNGTCYLYINNVLIGTYAMASALNSITTFGLGTYDTSQQFAFNGYIDDLKIYPFVAPINYLQSAVSGSGQYLLASAQSGHLISSSNYGTSWVSQGPILGGGAMYITPNQSGLASSTWVQNGVTWTASASSVYSGSTPAYQGFDNSTSTSWATTSIYLGTGIYNGLVTTTIQGGVGTISGEWIQLQASSPLVLSSYAIASANANKTMKTYYVVGSNDGSTWFPLQYTTMTVNPALNGRSSTILVNYTGTQTIQGTATGSCTTTSYATSTSSYLYFRFVITNTWQDAICDMTEFYLNFTSPSQGTTNLSGGALALSHSGQYALATVGNAAGSVMPNQSGLATATWTQGGVGFTASASQTHATFFPYLAFNNNYTTGNGFYSSTNSYNASGVYVGGYSTSVQGIGTVGGDWVQIQSSTPLVLSSYTIASAGYTQFAKTYYWVGSTDGATWYPIQYGSITTTPFTANFQACTNYLQVNFSGAQSLTAGQTGSVSTTAYATSTNAYTYFRFIGVTNLATYICGLDIGELYLNFQSAAAVSTNFGATWTGLAGTPMTDQVLALSGSGQYALGTSNVIPFSRLTLNNTNADAQGGLTPTTGAGTVTYSTSIVKVGTHSALFSNTAGGTSGMTYLNYTLPTLFANPPAITMACWMYPTAIPASGWSSPFGLNNNTASGYGTNLGFTPTSFIQAQIYGSNGGAVYLYSLATIPINTWAHVALTVSGGSASLFVNGVFQSSTSLASVGNLLGIWSGGGAATMTNLYVGTLTTNFAAFAGYVDDVRLYTAALNANQIAALANNPSLDTQAISLSSNYLGSNSVSTPVFPSITSPVTAAASSFNGQYMVAVNGGTTNNVHYSTNYGATFSALTIPNGAGVPMVGCTMSADGSYMTVSSATTTYTLNLNSTGFSLAVGNQAGQTNQAVNAIAIGNQAGQTNQTANSIVLNASGSAVNATQSGFYVAPVAQATSAATTGSLQLLGYGTDGQVVQTSLLFRNASTNGESQIITVSNPVTLPSDQGAVHVLQRWYEFTSNTSLLDLMAIRTTTGGSWDTTGLRLQSRVDATFQGWIQFGGSAANYGLQFGVGGSAASPLSVPAAMTIVNGGNIGIGTATPTGRLTVYSSTADYSNTCVIQSPWAGITLDNTQLASGRKWGIFSGGTGAGIGVGSLGIFDITNNTYRLAIDSSGNVGIGVQTPAVQLDLSTDGARKLTTTTWSTGSDERLKTNITLADTGRCLEIMKAVPLKRYTWRSDMDRYAAVYDKSKLGWIAQDVETVLPKAVHTHPLKYNAVYEDVEVTQEDGTVRIEKKLVSEEVIEDCRSLDADQIYAVMYGALQKVIADKDRVEAQLAALTAWATAQGFVPPSPVVTDAATESAAASATPVVTDPVVTDTATAATVDQATSAPTN